MEYSSCGNVNTTDFTGYEKFILDVEMLGMMTRFTNGISMTEEDFAWDAYEEVGPGNHFLGSAHTIRHYEDAFFQPRIFHTDSFEKWRDDGSLNAGQIANGIWKKMLAEYEPPGIDDAVAAELEAYVAHRREEIRAGRERTEWKVSERA